MRGEKDDISFAAIFQALAAGRVLVRVRGECGSVADSRGCLGKRRRVAAVHGKKGSGEWVFRPGAIERDFNGFSKFNGDSGLMG